MLLLLILWACAHAPAPVTDPLALPPPHLPSPEAKVYTLVPGQSSDVEVARAARGLPWDESLSGAAGALAVESLNGQAPDVWTARWAAYRAGFAWPVRYVTFSSCALGCTGDDVVSRIRGSARPGDVLGLARARGMKGDTWVGLVGHPFPDLAPIARKHVVGDVLRVAPRSGTVLPGYLLSVVSPSGVLTCESWGALSAIRLGEVGEWWIELSLGPERVGFPVYAGMLPLAAAPLSADDLAGVPSGAPEQVAWSILATVREEFEGRAPTSDLLLAAAARARVQQALGNAATAPAPLVTSADRCQATLECRYSPAEGIASCFQRWLVTAADRAPLIDPRCRLAGVAAGADAAGSILFLEMTQE